MNTSPKNYLMIRRNVFWSGMNALCVTNILEALFPRDVKLFSQFYSVLFFVTLFFGFSVLLSKTVKHHSSTSLKLIKACLKPFKLETRFGSFFR